MKKTFLIIYLLLFSAIGLYSQTLRFAQSTPSGDIYYWNKDRGEGGRAMVHLAGNILAFNYGNDFAGGTRIGADAIFKSAGNQYQFELNGAIKATDINAFGQISIGNRYSMRDMGQIYMYLKDTLNTYGELGFRFDNINYKSIIRGRINQTGTILDFITSTRATSSQEPRMRITGDGKVGIGTTSPSALLDVNGDIKGKKLDINGTIRAKEVKIEATGWADFVFDKNYKLPSLQSVEQHIVEKQHLPDMPSEKEVLEEGVNVVDMQAKLLQKIEELTLYVIQLDKENKVLKQEIKELKEK
jgi:hypothetical protein